MHEPTVFTKKKQRAPANVLLNQFCDSPESRSKILAATPLLAFREESNSDFEASNAFNSFSLIFVACIQYHSIPGVARKSITNDWSYLSSPFFIKTLKS